ncbi:MAG: hypothetical protein ABIR57_04515 [Aeromicrobium sp.]
MRSKLMNLLTVIGAATVLVLAANTVALATTGKALLAGEINYSTKLTSIVRTTTGTGLQIKTKSTINAPLAVNGTGKVTNLNADKVDGLDSSALVNRTYSWTKNVDYGAASTNFTLPLPPGDYVVGYSAFLIQGGVDNEIGSCEISRFRGIDSAYFAEDTHLTKTGDNFGFNGTSPLKVAAGDFVRFRCTMPHNFYTVPAEPIRIWATRTNITGGG